MILYALYAFIANLNASLLKVGTLFRLAQYLCIACLLILCCISCVRSSFGVKKLVLIFFLLGASAFSIYTAGSMTLLTTALFILCARFTSFDKIVKVSTIVSGLSVLCVVGLCKMGVIADYIYFSKGQTLHGYGFPHYTEISYFIFFLFLEYIYLRREKLSWLEIFGAAVVFVINYKLTTQRLVFYLGILVIILCVVIIKLKLLDITSTYCKIYSWLSVWICAVIAIGLSYFYNSQNSIMRIIDEITTRRLYYGNLGFSRYGVHFFPQRVVMYGASKVAFENASEYFFLDSGYVASLICNGIILTLVFLVLYSVMCYSVCVRNQKALFIWLISIIVFAMINDSWILIRDNPLILAAPTLLSVKKGDKIENIEYMQKKKLHFRCILTFGIKQ